MGTERGSGFPPLPSRLGHADRGNGRRVGVKMAQELLEALRPHVQGVYLMPSFGRYEVAAEVLEILEREPVAR